MIGATMTEITAAFSIREFCARYGICRDTFYRELKRGRLRAMKLGRKTIVLRADADTWAASLPELKLRASARSATNSSTA
jgi:excisionase family DNA binding protein